MAAKFVAESCSFDVDVLPPEDKLVFSNVVAAMYKMRSVFFKIWESLPKEIIESNVVIRDAGMKFTILETGLKRVGVFRQSGMILSGLDTIQQFQQIEVLDKPFIQLVQSPTVAILKTYKLKKGEVKLKWTSIEDIKRSICKKLNTLCSEKEKVEHSAEALRYFVRSFQPEKTVIFRHPVKKEVERGNMFLKYFCCSYQVSHIRICIDCANGLSEVKNVVEFDPAWANTSVPWIISGWKPQTWLPDPTQLEHDGPAEIQLSKNLTFLYWNVNGANNHSFVEEALYLKAKHSPKLMIFSDIQVDTEYANTNILSHLRYDSWIANDYDILYGGLCMAWDSAAIRVVVLNNTAQQLEIVAMESCF